jgi:RNA polymerase sigma-70 factor (ECF subfamily)
MRNVIMLRDINGLPLKDVADQLGITVSAAKSRLVRARAEMRTRMKKHYTCITDSSATAHSAAPLSRVGHHCPIRYAS